MKAALQLLFILFAFVQAHVNAQQESVPYVVPGNAAWLGGNETGDGTPPYQEFLPFPYVILGDQAVAIVRVIVDLNQECPSMMLMNGATQDVELPEVTLRAAGNNTLPYAFPIKVCEAQLETSAQKTAWSDGSLRLHGLDGIDTNIKVPQDPQRFALVADTGLRVKPTNLGLGNCDNTTTMFKLYDIDQCPVNFTEADLIETPTGDYQSLDDWHVNDLMNKIVEQDPDVIIYMGDYLYRQGPCPTNNTENETCTGINEPEHFDDSNIPPDLVANFVPGYWGDNWFGWWADFFYPASNLLHKAPFIAIRGNHEICARAGYGYFLLLSQEPYNGTEAGTYCQDYTEPYQVPFENEQFLIMDDSFVSPLNKGIDHFTFAPGNCPPPPKDGEDPIVPTVQNRYNDPDQNVSEINEQLAKFTAYMEQVRIISESYETNFYASHRPVFAVACDNTSMVTLDWTMQESLESNTLDRVVGMIGGHMHWLEALTFQDHQLPSQLVVGHGGTKMIPNYVNQSTLPGLLLQVGREDQGIQGTVERGITDSRMFGFVLMDRTMEGDYNVTFLSLNTTLNETVRVDFPLVIPKGPRVVLPSSSSSRSDQELSLPSMTMYGLLAFVLFISYL